MLFKLEFRRREPIYTQLVAQVQQMVAAGTLRPGDRLPTVRQLATELDVNFNTVARAYRQLHTAGVISTQQGRGTYILEQPVPADQRRLRRQRLAELTAQFVAEAQRLGYTAEEITQSLGTSLAAKPAAPHHGR